MTDNAKLLATMKQISISNQNKQLASVCIGITITVSLTAIGLYYYNVNLKKNFKAQSERDKQSFADITNHQLDVILKLKQQIRDIKQADSENKKVNPPNQE